jgi:phage terminase large subunit-like protein
MGLSLKEKVQKLPKAEKEEWLAKLAPEVLQELRKSPWWFIGRPEQQEPEGDWFIWLILSGRGWERQEQAQSGLPVKF